MDEQEVKIGSKVQIAGNDYDVYEVVDIWFDGENGDVAILQDAAGFTSECSVDDLNVVGG